jgi:hypothetical protein
MRIVAVDSANTNATVSIARFLNTDVYIHHFKDYVAMFSCVIDNTSCL